MRGASRGGSEPANGDGVGILQCEPAGACHADRDRPAQADVADPSDRGGAVVLLQRHRLPAGRAGAAAGGDGRPTPGPPLVSRDRAERVMVAGRHRRAARTSIWGFHAGGASPRGSQALRHAGAERRRDRRDRAGEASDLAQVCPAAQPEHPYGDSTLVAHHLADLKRFVTLARSGGAIVGIVPVTHQARAADELARTYDGFERAMSAAGLPVWRIEGAFVSYRFADLRVDAVDSHMNATAHQLAANAVLPVILDSLANRR